MTNKEAARRVVATVIRRNIEIAEAGAIDARYRDLLDAAEVLDEQAAIWRELLIATEGE
jgi:hypothetical protein